ncbi:MAG: hypothetical protein WCX65_08485 [bacterium]
MIKLQLMIRASAVALLAALFIGIAAPKPAAAKDEQGALYFTFVSSAYYMEKKWGHGMPLDGIKRVAEIAHSNGIPVTWLVNPKSAEEGKGLFKEYHDKYGDAVGYMLTGGEAIEKQWGDESYLYRRLSNKKLAELVAGEVNSIKTSLPWADLQIAGGGFRSNRLVKIFESLGFTGLWGHCWEQTLTDNISDRGAPWGFYYVNPNSFKAPSLDKRGLVAIEWTARDLNIAFRTGMPETYSTDPNDVGRAGICDANQCDYWKWMTDQYARNAKYNKIVPFAVHQEAHEMENSDKVKAYDPESIRAAGLMLDTLFKYVNKIGAKVVNANDAIKAYRAINETTPPTYALFDDTLLKKYPEILVYFDVNGQLFFDRGKTNPVFIRNYMGNPNSDVVDFAGVKNLPVAACNETAKNEYSCAVEADKEIAFGLAFWGDYKSVSVKGMENPSTKILDGELAYVAWPLKPGKNQIEVILK